MVSDYLARRYHATLILTGRSSLDDRKQDVIEALTRHGAEVLYLPGDVANLEDVKGWVKEAKARFGGIDYVIHSAGVIDDQLMVQKPWEEVEAVLAPKVRGVINLDTVLGAERLKGLVFFSSLSSLLGNVGQSDYAAANGYMDGFAAWRNGEVAAGRRYGRTVSVNWPLWQDGGMKVSEATEAYLAGDGLEVLPTEAGLVALEGLLHEAGDHYGVMYGRHEKIQALWKRPQEEDAMARLATPGVDEQAIRAPLLAFLTAQVADTLKLAPDNVRIEKDLSQLGFDSITFTTLANRLRHHYGVSITPALFFQYATLNRFADYLLRDYPDVMARFYRTEAQTRVKAPLRMKEETMEQKRPIKPSFVPKRTASTEDSRVAIIGMAGSFPKSPNLEAFWTHLCEGQDCISRIPASRFSVASEEIPNWAGLIDDIDTFDAGFFSYFPAGSGVDGPAATDIFASLLASH